RETLCRRARPSADATGAGGVGEQPARRAGTISHLRPGDQRRGGTGHPAPPGKAGNGAAGPAMGDRGERGALEAPEPRLPVLTGQRLRLNLEGGVIANLSSGDRLPVRNLSEELLRALRARLGR